MILPNIFSLACNIHDIIMTCHDCHFIIIYWCVFFCDFAVLFGHCCCHILRFFGARNALWKSSFRSLGNRESWMSAMVMKASHVLWETGRTQSRVCAQVMQVFLNLGVHCLFCSSCCWFVYNNLNVMTSWRFFLVVLFCEPSLRWQDIQFKLIPAWWVETRNPWARADWKVKMGETVLSQK